MGTGVGTLPEFHVTFNYRLEMENDVIGYFTECTGLGSEWEVFEIVEGGQNDFVHKRLGRRKYSNITLKSGITSDLALLQWFEVMNGGGVGIDCSISLLDQTGKVVARWSLTGAMPVKWQGPSLTAKSNEVATETLEIAHSGFRAGTT
jgi:phage tail-like protein